MEMMVMMITQKQGETKWRPLKIASVLLYRSFHGRAIAEDIPARSKGPEDRQTTHMFMNRDHRKK